MSQKSQQREASENIGINSSYKNSAYAATPVCGGCCLIAPGPAPHDERYAELDGRGKDEYLLRCQIFGKWCCGIVTLLLIIVIIVIFTAIIPNMAQQSVDNASLIPLYLSIIDPTNHSITMNSTFQIVNAGSFEASMDAATATLLYKKQAIGSFEQPAIHLQANTGATFHLLSAVNITSETGRELVNNMTRDLFNGKDVQVSFTAKPKVHPKIMGVRMPAVSVNMNKEMSIPATPIQEPYIRNITNPTKMDVNNVTVFVATMEYSVPSTLVMKAKNLNVSIYDSFDNELGYGLIEDFELVPGYNKQKSHVKLVACKTCSNSTQDNNVSIANFIQQWFNHKDQYLSIRGPVGDVVIANTLDITTLVYGLPLTSQ